jgi:hypothetical protein
MPSAWKRDRSDFAEHSLASSAAYCLDAGTLMRARLFKDEVLCRNRNRSANVRGDSTLDFGYRAFAAGDGLCDAYSVMPASRGQARQFS